MLHKMKTSSDLNINKREIINKYKSTTLTPKSLSIWFSYDF